MRKVRTLLVATGLTLTVGLVGCGQKETAVPETTQQIVEYTEPEESVSENVSESIEVEETEESSENMETDAVTEISEENTEESTEESIEVEVVEVEATEETEALEIEKGLMLPGESSWVDVGNVERQFENFKAVMPEGYRYMGYCDTISSFSKLNDDKLITAIVWYQDIDTSDTTLDLSNSLSNMNSAELTLVAETIGKSLVNEIGSEVSNITTSIEKIDGESYIALQFNKDTANGYFIFTLKDSKLQGVMTVTDMTKDVAESDALDIINSIEFNEQFCEDELNIQFTDNAVALVN